jgi:hypothetical protein
MGASVKTTIRTSSDAWTTVLTTESITPVVIAVGPGSPCLWKKRMSTPIRATCDGIARFR